jgi:hypothetical protein
MSSAFTDGPISAPASRLEEWRPGSRSEHRQKWVLREGSVLHLPERLGEVASKSRPSRVLRLRGSWVSSFKGQGVVSNATTRTEERRELRRSYLQEWASMRALTSSKFQRKGRVPLIRIVVARSIRRLMAGMEE